MVESSSRQNDAPEDVHILTPGTSEDGLSHGKTDFRLSGWGLSSQCPCMREAGGSESVTEDGMMKARSWNDASERPQDKEHSSLWKPEKAQKQILPQPPKGPAL